MPRPLKALAVRVGRARTIHLAHARFPATAGLARQSRRTLCGKGPAIALGGLPTSQPEAGRCPACYALIDAYGYPRELAEGD